MWRLYDLYSILIHDIDKVQPVNTKKKQVTTTTQQNSLRISFDHVEENKTKKKDSKLTADEISRSVKQHEYDLLLGEHAIYMV